MTLTWVLAPSGQAAGSDLFLHIFVQKPLSQAGSVTLWPATSHARRATPLLIWTLSGTFQSCGSGGRWRNSLLRVALAFFAKCPQLRELVLSVPLCSLLGSSALGHVRGQRAHLLPESTDDVPDRVGDFCYKTRAGVGDSVTPCSRDTFHMVHPTPLLAPVSLDRLGLQCDSPV